MHAINFLTAVSRSVHHALFEGADTLRQICESIVIPNLRMREDMVRACPAAVGVGRGVCAVGLGATVLAHLAAVGCHASVVSPTSHALFLLSACTPPTHSPTHPRLHPLAAGGDV
jgi:hypothetical protein